MGYLSDMVDFLEDTFENLTDINEKLDKIQEFFNNNFSNINEVRNREIEFLQNEFFSNLEKFPEKIKNMCLIFI